jgi:hypothetical protein
MRLYGRRPSACSAPMIALSTSSSRTTGARRSVADSSDFRPLIFGSLDPIPDIYRISQIPVKCRTR